MPEAVHDYVYKRLPSGLSADAKANLAFGAELTWEAIHSGKSAEYAVCYGDGTAWPSPRACNRSPIHALCYINAGFVGMWEWLCESCYNARVEEEADIVAEVLVEEVEAHLLDVGDA